MRWTQRRLISHFLAEVEAGRIDLEPLVTHVFDFAQATEAYDALDGAGPHGHPAALSGPGAGAGDPGDAGSSAGAARHGGARGRR